MEHGANLSRWRRSETWLAWLLPLTPVAALIALVNLSFRGKRVWVQLRDEKTDILLWLALGIVGFISAISGYDPGRGFINWLIPFLFIWSYALGRWGIVDPEHFLRSFLRGTAILAVIVIIARIVEAEVYVGQLPVLADFGPWGRGNVLAVPSNGLAVLLAAGASGGVGMFFASKSRTARLEAIMITILSIAAVFVTASRGAMVGIAAGLIAGGFLFSPLSVLVLAATAFFAGIVSPGVQQRIMSIVDVTEDESNIGRLHIWEGSWNLLKDHFFLGVGPGNFGLVYPDYAKPGYEFFGSPHNLYLNLTIGWGIFGGLLFFGWVVLVMIRALLRGLGPTQKIIYMILIAFWVHVLFDDLISIHVAFLLGALESPALTQNRVPGEAA